VVGTAYPVVYGQVDKMLLPWIAADYQHSNDKYLLAGHPIYDTTSTDILLWYDLEEKDPADTDANVPGGEIPNPMKVTHSGLIEDLGADTIQEDALSSDFIGSDSDDYLNNRQHIDNNFFGSTEGWGTLKVYTQGGGVETRYINNLQNTSGTKGTLTVTENFSGNVAVGDSFEIDLSGYVINSDTTDNFSNKIAYAQLSGDERNPTPVFDFFRPHLHWNLRRGLGSSKVYATFRGHKDDIAGTVTGVANSLIENPADVIKHFMLNYTLIRDDATLLDTESFEIAKRKRLDWKFGGAITETEEGETLLERYCSQSGIIYYWKDGKFKIKAIDVDTPTPVFKFEENVNIYEGIKVKRTTIEKIKNNIHIMYKYSWVKEDFIFRAIKDKNTDRFCKTSAGRYGDSEPEEFEALDIYETSTALKLGSYMVKLFADIYYVVTMKVPKSYFAIELGDIITITHSIGASLTGAGWIEKKFIVTKVQDKFTNMELTARSFIGS